MRVRPTARLPFEYGSSSRGHGSWRRGPPGPRRRALPLELVGVHSPVLDRLRAMRARDLATSRTELGYETTRAVDDELALVRSYALRGAFKLGPVGAVPRPIVRARGGPGRAPRPAIRRHRATSSARGQPRDADPPSLAPLGACGLRLVGGAR
jgi:hypothetical protein